MAVDDAAGTRGGPDPPVTVCRADSSYIITVDGLSKMRSEYIKKKEQKKKKINRTRIEYEGINPGWGVPDADAAAAAIRNDCRMGATSFRRNGHDFSTPSTRSIEGNERKKT